MMMRMAWKCVEMQNRVKLLFLLLCGVSTTVYFFHSWRNSDALVPQYPKFSVSDFANSFETVPVISVSDYLASAGNVTTVAVGLGITSRGARTSSSNYMAGKFEFFHTLLPSFCRTASDGFLYIFYLAYDAADPMFSNEVFLKAFRNTFFLNVRNLCEESRGIKTFISFVRCEYEGKPAWAQNDAMMAAYMDGIDYYYRINDDTEMDSADWTRDFVMELASMTPPNVGVVGPTHSGGETEILTYDFVHKTHIEIFGFYYPRLYTDWSADTWITYVYLPDRSLKLPNVTLKHVMASGTRYEVHRVPEETRTARENRDRVFIERYVEYVERKRSHEEKKPSGRRVIAMCLYGSNSTYTWGAIRNTQLLPVHFPGWKLRFFVPVPNKIAHRLGLVVAERILDILRRLGARISYIELKPDNLIEPSLWRYHILFSRGIKYFLMRDADGRLDRRDAAAVESWIENVNSSSVHCIRDHPFHSSHDSIVDGLWGGRTRTVRLLLNKTLSQFGVRAENIKYFRFGDKTSRRDEDTHNEMLSHSPRRVLQANGGILSSRIVVSLQIYSYCRENISCQDWPNSAPYPLQRADQFTFVGQKFDEFENPVGDGADLSNFKCVVEQ